MKKVEAIIRRSRLIDVKESLHAIGVLGMTASEVFGAGRQNGLTETYRGVPYTIPFRPKIKLEVVVPDEEAAEVIATILRAARTGEVGDGKIFISEMVALVRIRTGEVETALVV